VTALRRSPYLMLAAFAALLLAPPWATVAMVAIAVAVTAVRTIRFNAGRTRRPAIPEDAILLGREGHGRQAWTTERKLSMHALILGASGSGKTTTLLRILTQLIARGRPVVVIDMKGSPSLARGLERAAAAAGRPFRVWSPDGPTRWNPLQHGNATELKDRLMGAERFTEPHYKRAAERYALNALQVLEAVHPGRAPTLAEVVQLMDPNRLPLALRGVPGPLAERVRDYKDGLTSDQISAVRGLQTRLAVMVESVAGPHLEPGPDSIDIRRALSGPEVVLFSLNSNTYGELADQLGTLVLQDLISATGHRLNEREHGSGRELAVVAIDESAVLGKQLLTLFARGREAGVGAISVSQEMVDYDRIARGLRDQVLGNTAVKLIHRQRVPDSAQLVARMAGTERRWETTEQLGWSGLFGSYGTGRGTRRLVERFIVEPNEIMALRRGDALQIANGPGERSEVIRVDPPQSVGPGAGTAKEATRRAVGGTPSAMGAAPSATAVPRMNPGRTVGQPGRTTRSALRRPGPIRPARRDGPELG
jgi:conjugal transfer pilus assembly protein TraD